jgi:hypothetical protein
MQLLNFDPASPMKSAFALYTLQLVVTHPT